jgi:hypothetical protein
VGSDAGAAYHIPRKTSSPPGYQNYSLDNAC